MLSKHVTFDETSLLKSTMKSTNLSVGREVENQGCIAACEVDATPPLSVGSVSLKISPNVSPGGDRVAALAV